MSWIWVGHQPHTSTLKNENRELKFETDLRDWIVDCNRRLLFSDCFTSRLLKKSLKSKSKLVQSIQAFAGLCMAFKHLFLLATDLDVNFGCNQFKFNFRISDSSFCAPLCWLIGIWPDALFSNRSLTYMCCFHCCTGFYSEHYAFCTGFYSEHYAMNDLEMEWSNVRCFGWTELLSRSSLALSVGHNFFSIFDISRKKNCQAISGIFALRLYDSHRGNTIAIITAHVSGQHMWPSPGSWPDWKFSKRVEVRCSLFMLRVKTLLARDCHRLEKNNYSEYSNI